MADPLLSFQCLSRVLPYTHRPRRMPRAPLLRFTLPCMPSASRRHADDRLPTASSSSRGQAHVRSPRHPRPTPMGKPTFVFRGVFSQSSATLVRPPTASSDSHGQAHVRLPLPSSVSRGQAHDRPSTGGVRFSGFTRKRGIPLRGAKFTLMRFAAFLLQSFLEKRPTQCADDQSARSAIRTHVNECPSSLLGQTEALLDLASSRCRPTEHQIGRAHV